MLSDGLCALTKSVTSRDAWRSILGDARTVTVKFNSVGAALLSVTPPLARAIVKQLEESGYTTNAVTLVEVDPALTDELGTQPPLAGWGAPISVGGESEPVANWLYATDAVINVGFVKTHPFAGMSACMKNLSHAVIRRPARYHANGCAPYVGQIIDSPPVRDRLRVNVVNALRAVADHGPDATADDVVDTGALVIGFDPVAVDTIAAEVLARARRRLGLPAPDEIRYLHAAGDAGVGRSRATEINRIRLSVQL